MKRAEVVYPFFFSVNMKEDTEDRSTDRLSLQKSPFLKVPKWTQSFALHPITVILGNIMIIREIKV